LITDDQLPIAAETPSPRKTKRQRDRTWSMGWKVLTAPFFCTEPDVGGGGELALVRP